MTGVFIALIPNLMKDEGGTSYSDRLSMKFFNGPHSPEIGRREEESHHTKHRHART
jgi:hypothetical protein